MGDRFLGQGQTRAQRTVALDELLPHLSGWCVVSYTDSDELCHLAQVEAETLRDAGSRAVAIFSQRGCSPAPDAILKVEARGLPVCRMTARQAR